MGPDPDWSHCGSQDSTRADIRHPSTALPYQRAAHHHRTAESTPARLNQRICIRCRPYSLPRSVDPEPRGGGGGGGCVRHSAHPSRRIVGKARSRSIPESDRAAEHFPSILAVNSALSKSVYDFVRNPCSPLSDMAVRVRPRYTPPNGRSENRISAVAFRRAAVPMLVSARTDVNSSRPGGTNHDDGAILRRA